MSAISSTQQQHQTMDCEEGRLSASSFLDNDFSNFLIELARPISDQHI
jgi:hypothetical protein